MRIAAVTAWRTTGSPERAANRRKAARKSCGAGSVPNLSMPVRRAGGARSASSAQVEALTKAELECPRWRAQSASPSLSRISRSTVPASGMRSTPRRGRAAPPLPARTARIRAGRVDAALAVALAADRGDQPGGRSRRCGRALRAGCRPRPGSGVRRGLVEPGMGADRRAQWRGGRQRGAKDDIHGGAFHRSPRHCRAVRRILCERPAVGVICGVL